MKTQYWKGFRHRERRTVVLTKTGGRSGWNDRLSLSECRMSFKRYILKVACLKKDIGCPMRRINILLLMLCGMAFRCAAEVKDAATRALLDSLDEAIAEKISFQKLKDDSIRTLELRLSRASGDMEKYEIINCLLECYLHYQTDSALFYIEKKAELFPGNVSLKNEVMVNRAEVMGLMGMYNEALEVLGRVNPEELDRKLIGQYYQTYQICYGWLADYTVDVNEKQKYLLKSDLYQDSVISVMSPDPKRRLAEVEVMLRKGKAEEAVYVLDSLRNSTSDDKFLAYVNFTEALAWEQIGDKEMLIRSLARTALIDVKRAVREYAGLPKLARVIYEAGDLRRAYLYLQCSMEDAVACNARLRFMEVTEVYPIIDKAYREKEAHSHKVVRILLWSVSGLALVLVVLALYLHYGLKKLSYTRRHLYEVIRELHATNEKLIQTGKIKEVYIAKYLDRCVGYLDKQEQYRRSLEKLAMASKLDELFKTIRSEQFLKDERKSFYNEFDRSFLDLFPNFINDFNNLLVEEGRIFPKSGEILNTELRIFALIRLGVTDTTRIAHFLGYSLATVYNYRSKIRNRSKGDKESFEQEVMNL